MDDGRQTSRRLRPTLDRLERREMLTHKGIPARPALLATTSAAAEVSAPVPVLEAAPHPYNALRPGGASIAFNHTSNYRRTLAAQVTHRLSEAFQAFAYHVLNQPVTITGFSNSFGGGGGSSAGGSTGTASGSGSTDNGTSSGSTGAILGPIGGIPIGIIPSPPTLANYVNLLGQESAIAIQSIETSTLFVQPSIAKGPKYTPRPQDSLTLFASQRIAGLGATLTTSTPRFNADGTLATPTSLAAVNSAYNAIINAVAEYAVHPELFQTPSAFYINPKATYTITFGTDPVARSNYFYLLGTGGLSLRAS